MHRWSPGGRHYLGGSAKRSEAQQERQAREREERKARWQEVELPADVERQVDHEERQQCVIADGKTTYDWELNKSNDAEPRDVNGDALYRFYGASCSKCSGGSEHFDYMRRVTHKGVQIYHTKGRGGGWVGQVEGGGEKPRQHIGGRSGQKMSHPFDRFLVCGAEPEPIRAALLDASRARRAAAAAAQPAA